MRCCHVRGGRSNNRDLVIPVKTWWIRRSWRARTHAHTQGRTHSLTHANTHTHAGTHERLHTHMQFPAAATGSLPAPVTVLRAAGSHSLHHPGSPADTRRSAPRPTSAPSWLSTSLAWSSWSSSTCWYSPSASGRPSSPRRKQRRATGIKRRWRCWATGASTWWSASSPWQAGNCSTWTGQHGVGVRRSP